MLPTLTEQFDKLCPYYMSIGMTYQEFWFEDCHLVSAYSDAHKLRITQRNQEMWLQGLYFASALESTVGNMFRKKGTKPIKYVEEPFDLFGKSEEEKRIEEEREREKVITNLKRLQTSMQRKFSGDK